MYIDTDEPQNFSSSPEAIISQICACNYMSIMDFPKSLITVHCIIIIFDDVYNMQSNSYVHGGIKNSSQLFSHLALC